MTTLNRSQAVMRNGHWKTSWEGAAAGVTAHELFLPQPFLDENAFEPQYLLLDGISLYWLDADADTGRVITPFFYSGTSLGAYLYLESLVTIGGFTTQLTLTDGLLVPPIDSDGTAFLNITYHGVAGEANDRLAASAWGRYESPVSVQAMPTVTPVSVEGYKWPLKRSR